MRYLMNFKNLFLVLFFAYLSLYSCGGNKNNVADIKNKKKISGILVNKKTGKGVEGEVLAIPAEDKTERIISYPTKKSGKFLFYLPKKKYILRFNAPNCRSVKLVLDKNKEFKKNKVEVVPIERPAQDLAVVLGNIQIRFDFKSVVIKPKFIKVLNKLVVILKKNPNVIIEIRGHTDILHEYYRNINKVYGRLRAKAVRNYLIRNGGINPRRLKLVTMGAENPIVPNDTAEHRAKNRRVDLRIISR